MNENMYQHKPSSKPRETINTPNKSDLQKIQSQLFELSKRLVKVENELNNAKMQNKHLNNQLQKIQHVPKLAPRNEDNDNWNF